MLKNLKKYSKRPNSFESGKINVVVFVRKDFVPSDLRLLTIFNEIAENPKYNFYIVYDNDSSIIKKDIKNNNLYFDFIVLQRDYFDFKVAKSLIDKSKLFNYKIIYEIDDNLVNMDESNPGFPYYNKIKKDLEYFIKNSDIVTVTTENLKKDLLHLNQNIIVIPNRLITSWFEDTNHINHQNNCFKIGYMGSIYHSWDLILIKDAINNVIKYFKEKDIKIVFELIGGLNESINWANQLSVPKDKTRYFKFIQWFKNIAQWDVAIAPLEDSNLNHGKSELKYLEYSALGIPGIYSNIGPYKENIVHEKNGLLVYENTSEEWANSIIRLIEDENLRKEIILNSSNDIKKNYLIEKSINQWLEIFEKNYEKKPLINYKLKLYTLKNKVNIKNIINIILNKSNSYKFYKKEYNSLLKKNKKLKKKIKNKNEIIELLDKRLEYNYNSFKYSGEIKDIKIAYVLNGFPILSETFIVNEVKWLIENGYDVCVFSRHDSYKPVQIDFNVEIINFRNKVDLANLLIEYEIDHIHTHFVYPIGSNFTFPVAEQLKIPFTIFTHAYDIFIKENNEKNNIDKISKSAYCLAIFTLSNFHKEFLLNNGVVENKIVITKQATNYNIKEIKIKKNNIKHIVSISRFVEKKGIDTLIDAAKLLEDKNYEFSIYGFGPLEDELKNKICDLNCKNISIKGELHPDKVEDILFDSDLLVSPCKIAKNGDMDGFPTIIFEAMGIGTPFVTTNVSAIPEIVNDCENGFIIEPDNPISLANKINQIANLSSDKMFKIRKNAQNDVINISSVEKTMLTFINTIKKNF